ncbi:4910_t:CDS:10 [Dentiscutata erythropus]|uniref:4910_t:CDS:1 n=1 Tax=Dentiscutata erythropus TaxID=1348616 RepID=A0A9N9FBG0_9GLOM|nr:4910_t:CDS:10 [Dentiscutata erythropus]
MPKLRPKRTSTTTACCHCGNTLHTSDACPLATIDIIEDDSDKNLSDVTLDDVDNEESDEKNSKKKKGSKAKSVVKKADDGSDQKSKRKRETKGKSVVSEPGSSSKSEGSKTKEKKTSKKRKVASSASRESSSDFTSEEPEWLKNSQNVTAIPITMPVETFNQLTSEADRQPAPTQDQDATERVFIAPYYVDLDATKVVGIQYYHGIVNKGEAVSIMREPTNPHDKNALRVDNVMGEQVGHVPRDVAAILSSSIDNGDLKIEATIIGNRGTYSIPLQLHVFGLPQKQETISKTLKKRGILIESPKEPRQTKKSLAEAASRAEFDETWRDLVGRGQQIGLKKKQEAFEKIGISIEDLEKLPEAPQPEALLTRLLPYQKQGLGWMLSHEHPAEPTLENTTQFWTLRRGPGDGSTIYYNVATSHASQTRPEFSREFLSCLDDMGLGKTLQTISLIVSDASGGEFITTPSPTSPNYSKTTLIVAPLSILGNWVDQINTHVKPDVLSYYVFHGPNRISDTSFLSGHDVVITVLASSNIKDKRRGLFAIKWRRVVLDEGHIIRTNKTKQSQAACALDAERRWILSGTPIMNQLNDMYSLVKFLRITPFQEYDLWTRVFSRPVSKGDFDGIDRLACLIRTTCLRRTKDMKFKGRSILDLPPINSYLHKVKFSTEEKKKYDLMDKTAKECFRKLENSGGRGSAAALLEILMRMRQICDHWKLAEDRLKLASENSLDLTPENAQILAKFLKEAIEDNEDCCICLDPLSSPVITLCRHVFDRECIEQVIEKQKHACPMCRKPIHKEQLIEQPLDSVETDEDSSENSDKGYVSSSKINALLEFLKVSREKDPASKSVVFSQWTSFLNLVEPALHHAKIKFVRLDGKMPRPKREDAMRMFQNDPEVKVFLISLKCGSLGLNLTAADQCFIMDPWWNPSIEDQAVDRIYRLGQTRPVSIFRFVIENTIEDRVIELQEKKRSMVSQAFGEKIRKDASKRLEARLEDLRALLTTK